MLCGIVLSSTFALSHFTWRKAVMHFSIACLNCSCGLGSGGGAQAAAFLGIEPADTNGRDQKHFLGISLLLSTAHPWAGQCKQQQWLWESDAGTLLMSTTPVGCGLRLCFSSNPALKTLQVPDHLHATEVRTDQSSFEWGKSGATLTKLIFFGRMRSTVSCCWKKNPPESPL